MLGSPGWAYVFSFSYYARLTWYTEIRCTNPPVEKRETCWEAPDGRMSLPFLIMAS